MTWKRNITIATLLLLSTGVFFLIKTFINRPKIVTNNNELVFLSDQDRIQIYKDIESVKTIQEFDYKVLDSFTDILDKYNLDANVEEYVISPEFMSDNPESITIVSGDRKLDLLEGLQITSLTNEDLPELKKFAHKT